MSQVQSVQDKRRSAPSGGTAQRRSVFDVRGLPPFAVVKDEAVRNNHAVMTEYCHDNGVLLAPHVKTSMAPKLIDLQTANGCWGVTVATVGQAAALREVRGYPRIVLANQLVDQQEVDWAANEILARGPFEFIPLVDTVSSVNRLDHLLSRTGTGVQMTVWIEIGVVGGRAGCRDRDAAAEVAAAVQRSRYLALAGIETYEGIVARDATAEDMDKMRRHLDGVACIATALSDAGYLPTDFSLSAGGSAFFDVVVDTWRTHYSASSPPRIVLRSGCYVAHDVGRYQRLSPMDGRTAASPTLQNALEVWGSTLSLPEPGVAVVGVGRRDISSDVEPPRPLHVRRMTGEIEPLANLNVLALYDHHVVLSAGDHQTARGLPLLGELVAFGPSHPCTTFDKWKSLYLVDRDYAVIDDLETLFH